MDFVIDNYTNFDRKFVTRLINIDTVFRNKSNSSSDYLYELKEPIHNVVSMRLATLEIPIIWKTFDSKSNFFTVYHDMSGGGKTRQEWVKIIKKLDEATDISSAKISIPVGNYSINNLILTINNLLNKEFTKFETYFKIEVTFDFVEGKLVFYENKGNGDKINYIISFGEYIETKNKTAGSIMGFTNPNGIYIPNTNDVYYNYITKDKPNELKHYLKGDSTFGTTIDTYIYLCINDFQNNVKNTVITDNSIDNILGRISISKDPFHVLIDSDSDKIFKTREYFGPVTLQKLHIQLKNKYGEIIDINDENFNFALEINQIYQ
jgi:hypothetical protein